jgi:hypothetical protein
MTDSTLGAAIIACRATLGERRDEAGCRVRGVVSLRFAAPGIPTVILNGVQIIEDSEGALRFRSPHGTPRKARVQICAGPERDALLARAAELLAAYRAMPAEPAARDGNQPLPAAAERPAGIEDTR